MAARSTGIFPREGFNLDNAFEMTLVEQTVPVNLKTARTFRVVMLGAEEVPATVDGAPGVCGFDIMGSVFPYTIDDFLALKDPNGVIIIHLRGYSLAGTDSLYSFSVTPGADNAGTGQSLTFTRAYIELVDGPAR